MRCEIEACRVRVAVDSTYCPRHKLDPEAPVVRRSVRTGKANPVDSAARKPTLRSKKGADGLVHLEERRCPRCRQGKVPIKARWGTLCVRCTPHLGKR